MRTCKGRSVYGLLAAVFIVLSPATAKSAEFGKPGEPVHLVVGHPCCYTEVWSVMVLHGKELWKKYLPQGSTVTYDVGLQGSTIVNSMLAKKQHIGYIGDLPAIIATTKENVADVRIVGVSGVAYDQCNILLARKDAPEFKSADEAAKWLSGKQMAVPKGTCSDIFARSVFERANVKPAAYLNQNVEVITSGFRAGKLDGAAIWEPVAARLVEEGLARRISSGVDYGLKDSSYIVMSAELISQRPDVVKGWLNAELDAQQFLADPANAAEVIKLVMTQTTGFPEKSLWSALYATYPKEQGGTNPRMELPFAFTPEVMGLMKKGTDFLYSIKGIGTAQLRPEAVMPQFAEAVLKDRKLSSPVGAVPALPGSAYHGK
ncbi:Sulfate starvation-induced protein 1 [Afipia felis]|uniref:Sulfate starvation-induced protein 1 n=1 Tax=Afipia felis TaxID=1035 RepID=A0A090MP47_AFIFE|nr:ABC transporter substrate-binding protein [Afipia sp. 1NLS2]EFI51389.1 ABC-type nitrate/sulfonate/bicarbonate transport systems periplasmic component-like protein [Afipia sp. 1NLS2]CEG09151.1 Sulfate starvation-induced protein 1 [Afipia felis]